MPQVYAAGGVLIECVPALGPYANNSYILRSGDRPAVLIDLPIGVEAAFDALGETGVGLIVLTHSHFDHLAGYDAARQHTAAQIVAGGEPDLDPAWQVRGLVDGERLPLGDTAIEVIATPGHTPGSICLLLGDPAAPALITGDTLFPGGPGRSASPAALRQELNSIRTRLYPLPGATIVLPGHGAGTTLGESKAEFAVFDAKPLPPDLHGDVTWLGS